VTFDPANPDVSANGMRLRASRPDHRDGTALLNAFYDEQVDRYGYADPVNLPPEEYVPPAGIFVIVYDGEAPVGCGACRWHDRRAGTVELQKIFLLPAARGRGGGHLLLNHLELEATHWGAKRVILETGVRNSAAIDLFVRRGYVLRPGYVSGRDPMVNRAFDKSLVAAR
jgi:GNAT superfamily N-acetyltransferase